MTLLPGLVCFWAPTAIFLGSYERTRTDLSRGSLDTEKEEAEKWNSRGEHEEATCKKKQKCSLWLSDTHLRTEAVSFVCLNNE